MMTEQIEMEACERCNAPLETTGKILGKDVVWGSIRSDVDPDMCDDCWMDATDASDVAEQSQREVTV